MTSQPNTGFCTFVEFEKFTWNRISYMYIKRWIVEKKCLFFTDWKVLLLFLMCVLDCLDAAGKWSWPQCHRQAGLHSTAQSICQGQLPAYPAASQTERFHQHPGHTGQHAAVSRNKYLSHVAHRNTIDLGNCGWRGLEVPDCSIREFLLIFSQVRKWRVLFCMHN